MSPPGFKTVTISERAYALLVIRARLARKTAFCKESLEEAVKVHFLRSIFE